MHVSTSTDPPAIPRFDEVFRDHAPLVWRALRRLGVREADVEDLCQEVFVVVHRKLPGFEGRAKLSTWIYGICVRVASDHRKRAHTRHESSSEAVPEGRLSAPQLNELAQAQARVLLDAVLAELDDDKRAVFVLYEIEELSMADVALAVGAPLQTAYSRLHAARKFVAESIGRRAEEGRV
jgi:RNA polymerase sigma-70 factor (ECF subfamily)